MSRYTLTIEALEDVHIGTGLGKGDIDNLHTRDRHGDPCIPATHIKGVLRAQAENLSGLFSSEFIRNLFGSTGTHTGMLALSSAWLVERTPATPLVWGSTRIDPATGTAAEDTLRFIEFAPAGSRFRAEISFPDNLRADVEQLLAVTSHLGHGRNRGHGRVRWRIDEHIPESLPKTQRPGQYPARLRLLLRNLDPLCLAQTGHPGNIIPSDSFMRGQMLRGALAGLCIAADEAALAQKLHQPAILWGDALPLPKAQTVDSVALADLQHWQVKPIALSIGTPKAAACSGLTPWWAANRQGTQLGARGEVEQISQTEKSAEKLKRPNADEYLFRRLATEPWQRYASQMQQRLRTQVPDQEMLDQALFSNEEIAEHTVFLSDILITNAEAAKTLQEAITLASQTWLRIGRAGRPVVIESSQWLAPSPHSASSGNNGFTLLCESDLLLRDEWLRYHTRLDANIIAAWLDLNDMQLETCKINGNYSDHRSVHGFNATTGLHRPVQIAIKAGSAIAIGGRDAFKLREVLSQRLSLGERAEEGFGRFSLDAIPQPADANIRLSQTQQITANSLCQQAKDWAECFKGLRGVSTSQLGEMRSRVLASQKTEDLTSLFQAIEEAANKHGGKNWRNLSEHKEYGAFKEQLRQLSLSEAQALLDQFFRWCRVLRNSGNTPQENIQ